MKCRFSVTSHALFLTGVTSLSFTLQLIWGNAVFVSVVAGVFTLSFVPRIVLTKLNNYMIPFFLI